MDRICILSLLITMSQQLQYLAECFQIQDSNSHRMIVKWHLCILNHCNQVSLLFNGKFVPIAFIQRVSHFLIAFGGQFTKIAKYKKC